MPDSFFLSFVHTSNRKIQILSIVLRVSLWPFTNGKQPNSACALTLALQYMHIHF